MKRIKIQSCGRLLSALAILVTMVATSCSDDEPDMPSNALSLNMMAGDDGTTIGGSDVSVNPSLNFATEYCGIADLGKKASYKAEPNLSQIAQEVAVAPGHYYQITLARSIVTVAGERAYPVNATYYNVYADSWIRDAEGNIAGAKVNYVERQAQTKLLPAWDESIDVELRAKADEYLETATYAFPKGCEIDKDVVVDDLKGELAAHLDCEVDGNKISFSNITYTPGCVAQATVLVRHESVYTRVRLKVASSM